MKKNLEVKGRWLELPFTQFPKIIDRMKEVDGTDKAILRVIVGRIMVHGGGRCFPSAEVIALDSGTCVVDVGRSIAKWEKIGILSAIKEQSGRVWYTLHDIPDWIVEKYGSKEKEVKEIDPAKEALEEAGKRAEEAHRKRLERARGKTTFGKVKPPKEKHPEVFTAIESYSRSVDNFFNIGKDEEHKVRVVFTKKETGQLSSFVNNYGLDAVLRVMHEIFSKWQFYKQKWRLEADYPTVGIIVTYGKSKVFSAEALPGLPPKKIVSEQAEEDDVEIKPGW
jgi:hypothetical protein